MNENREPVTREGREQAPALQPATDKELTQVEGGLLMPWHAEYWRMWRYVLR
jgi:hypothetical protein